MISSWSLIRSGLAKMSFRRTTTACPVPPDESSTQLMSFQGGSTVAPMAWRFVPSCSVRPSGFLKNHCARKPRLDRPNPVTIEPAIMVDVTTNPRPILHLRRNRCGPRTGRRRFGCTKHLVANQVTRPAEIQSQRLRRWASPVARMRPINRHRNHCLNPQNRRPTSLLGVERDSASGSTSDQLPVPELFWIGDFTQLVNAKSGIRSPFRSISTPIRNISTSRPSRDVSVIQSLHSAELVGTPHRLKVMDGTQFTDSVAIQVLYSDDEAVLSQLFRSRSPSVKTIWPRSYRVCCHAAIKSLLTMALAWVPS